MTRQISIGFGDEHEPKEVFVQWDRCIRDRGSVYSVTLGHVHNKEEMEQFMKELLKNKKYAKATHNPYAVRLCKEGSIWEGKRDDGETGAGMVILRLLKSANVVNTIVVVTRWYGGTKLGNDRYRHVQDGVRLALREGF